MEFMMRSEDLAKALNKCKNTYGSPTMPALNGIYLEADANGDCIAKSSNGSQSTVAKFTAQVVSPGRCLLDANILTKIAATFSTGPVEMKVDGFTATLTHPNGEIEIAGMDPDDFSLNNGAPEESGFMIGDDELKKALNAVSFACNAKSNVQKLAGVAIVIANGITTFAATDTRRIARYTVSTPSAQDFNIVVPPTLVKGLGAVDGNVAVRMNSHSITIENNDTEYRSVLLAQGFPPVENYFKQPEHASVTLSREQFINTLDRVILLAKADKADAHGKFTFDSNGSLDIQFSAARGKMKKETLSTQHTGPDVMIHLSANLLLEAVKRIDKDNIDLTFQVKNGNVVSTIVYPEGERDYGVFNMAVVGA